MREENVWCKKPRYSEVRVIARRVIARGQSYTINNVHKFRLRHNFELNFNLITAANCTDCFVQVVAGGSLRPAASGFRSWLHLQVRIMMV